MILALIPLLLGAGQELAPPDVAVGDTFFVDDFELGLGSWEVRDRGAFSVVDSGDPEHGKVLQMEPRSTMAHVRALGSEAWPAYRFEAWMLFPRDEPCTLGWIYNLTERDGRIDLGSIYVKGNDSYVRVNPRRDWNPARNLYEEYRSPLVGARAVEIGRWQRFAAEVVGNACHFYVGDLERPVVTFDLFEGAGGVAGLEPRVVGAPVWVDGVRVTAIAGFTYRGPPRPERTAPRPESLLTDWEVLGPLERSSSGLELDGGAGRASPGWRAFETDARGAVVTGRVVDFTGPRTVAYFRTTIEVAPGESAELQLSSIDDLAIWVDGRFRGYGEHERFAHHDFGRNPAHPPSDRVRLGEGVHLVLIRIRGGRYAAGGFFARVVRS